MCWLCNYLQYLSTYFLLNLLQLDFISTTLARQLISKSTKPSMLLHLVVNSQALYSVRILHLPFFLRYFVHLPSRLPLSVGFSLPCQPLLLSSLWWWFIISQILNFGVTQGSFFLTLLFSAYSLSGDFSQSSGFKYQLHSRDSQTQLSQAWIPKSLSNCLFDISI